MPGMSLIAEYHVLIVVILAEWVVLLMAAAVYLLHRQRRLKARLVQLAADRRSESGSRDGLLDYLRQSVQTLVRAYRGRWGDKIAVLQRGDILKAPEQAAQVAVQLQYDLLRNEIAQLQAGDNPDPDQRRPAWENLLGRFTEAQRALDRFEEGLRERYSGEAEHERRQAEQAKEVLSKKLQRREVRIEQLQHRVTDLEGYRERFNRLHAQILEERKANTELHRRLRDSVERTGDTEAEAALRSCDERAGELDALLAQPDIAPLGGQHRRGPAPEVDSVEVRAVRTTRLAEVGAERLAATLVTMRDSLRQQQQLVGDLRAELDNAGLREGRLKSYYQQQVRRLQEMVDQFRSGMDSMEKENLRARRTIRRLTGDLRARNENDEQREALEATIDRFATQAIDMQRRIIELESALTSATAEALRAADEKSSLSPVTDGTV